MAMTSKGETVDCPWVIRNKEIAAPKGGDAIFTL